MGITLPITTWLQGAQNQKVTTNAFLALALVGCAYNTDFTDCVVHCSTDTSCPDSLTCGAEGLCRVPGATETCAAITGSPQSCAELAATCGPNQNEDCCSALELPGGTFFRSHDVANDAMYPNMSYPAKESPFVLDRFEVTVGRFRKFVETGRGTRSNAPSASSGSRSLNGTSGQGGWEPSWDIILTADTTALVVALKCNEIFQTWTDARGPNEELPINCVTWYEAFAFCVWDGGFLPTETEWNFAAAGGSEQRAYSWSKPADSTVIDCTRTNYGICGSAPKRAGDTSPLGDGLWGHADLGGNMWEWSLDWYHNQYENPCSDCANTTPTTSRTVRGGGFVSDPTLLRIGHRHGGPPTSRYRDVGLRCARNHGAAGAAF